MVRKLYPHGKKKAFNVTYDDGVLQDVPFVELLNRYGLKGTFNLNSALMETEFEWTHPCGLAVKRLKSDIAVSLYEGHEVASHSLSHPYMHSLSREDVLRELYEDKTNLERLFGREIRGFALPFDYYSELIEDCAKLCGFDYARISEESYSFSPQRDFFKWRATVFHCCEGLEDITRRFIESEEELALFQIVGHSYDLETEGKWELIENVFHMISEQEDILPMTNIEIVDYLKAMGKAEITGRYIQNNSNMSLWFAVDKGVCEVRPNERLELC